MNPTIPSPANMPKRAANVDLSVRFRRGEVWRIESSKTMPSVGNEIWSDRFGVIVSNNTLNARTGVAEVVYLTTSSRRRVSPTHVEVPSHVGEGTVIALCEQVHTVDASRLTRKAGELPAESMTDIGTGLAMALGVGGRSDIAALFRKWEAHIKNTGVDMALAVEALAGETADQRTMALTNALRLMTRERDAYRALHEASAQRGAVLAEVERALATT